MGENDKFHPLRNKMEQTHPHFYNVNKFTHYSSVFTHLRGCFWWSHSTKEAQTHLWRSGYDPSWNKYKSPLAFGSEKSMLSRFLWKSRVYRFTHLFTDWKRQNRQDRSCIIELEDLGLNFHCAKSFLPQALNSILVDFRLWPWNHSVPPPLTSPLLEYQSQTVILFQSAVKYLSYTSCVFQFLLDFITWVSKEL